MGLNVIHEAIWEPSIEKTQFTCLLEVTGELRYFSNLI